jgi:hypothetical protein
MWASRETKELYEHISVPDPETEKLFNDALRHVRSNPELWSDFGRQAVRALSVSLRPTPAALFGGRCVALELPHRSLY